MAGQRNYGGVYANMDFDAIYGSKAFHEYPKHISTGGKGQYTVVHSAAEEHELLNRIQKDQDDAPAYVAPYVTDPEKEILISRARELGVAFNSKWSKMKLKQTVEAAEQDVDNLPAEQVNKVKVTAMVIDNNEKLEAPQTDEEFKDKLIAEAKSFGYPANRLWGIPRLQTSISEAKAKLKE